MCRHGYSKTCFANNCQNEQVRFNNFRRNMCEQKKMLIYNYVFLFFQGFPWKTSELRIVNGYLDSIENNPWQVSLNSVIFLCNCNIVNNRGR